MGITTHQRNNQSGFTITELIVVVVVIVILAAVSIVGYGEWRESVAGRELISDLNGVEAAMESARNWSDTGYPEFADDTVFDGANTTSDVFQSSESVTLTYQYGDTEGYCIEAVSVTIPTMKQYLLLSGGQKTTDDGICPPAP